MDPGDGSGLEHGEIAEDGIALDLFGEQVGNGGVRDGEDEGVRALFAPSVELRGGDDVIFDAQGTSGGAEIHLPALLFDGGFAAVIELRERDGGNPHAVAGAVG